MHSIISKLNFILSNKFQAKFWKFNRITNAKTKFLKVVSVFQKTNKKDVYIKEEYVFLVKI